MGTAKFRDQTEPVPILAKRHLLDTCLLRMAPFRSMLLTLRSGPESLTPTARQGPVYLMVVILHIPMPCLHGAANCRHRPWHIAGTTTTYSSWPRDVFLCPN